LCEVAASTVRFHIKESPASLTGFVSPFPPVLLCAFVCYFSFSEFHYLFFLDGSFTRHEWKATSQDFFPFPFQKPNKNCFVALSFDPLVVNMKNLSNLTIDMIESNKEFWHKIAPKTNPCIEYHVLKPTTDVISRENWSKIISLLIFTWFSFSHI